MSRWLPANTVQEELGVSAKVSAAYSHFFGSAGLPSAANRL